MSSNAKFDVNSLRIASPCTVRWQDLDGDDRKRRCTKCKLDVYNVAGMRRGDVAELVSRSEGRLCLVLLRRADGTVILKDCPVGARQTLYRIGKVAAAIFVVVVTAFWIKLHPDRVAGDPYSPDPKPNLTPMVVPEERGKSAPAARRHGEFPEIGKAAFDGASAAKSPSAPPAGR